MKNASNRHGGWTLNAKYKHYLEVVNKYEASHDTFKIHKYSKQEFKRKMNTLQTLKEEGQLKRITYKKIVEDQVFTGINKKTARKLYRMAQKDPELKKTILHRRSIEKIGRTGIQGLTYDQAAKVADILSEAYYERRAKGYSAKEAKQWISEYYFGS